MKAAEWIDKVKLARGWDSDYRAAKELGLSRQTVSGYRSDRYSMDEEAAIKVASALGERPEAVILDQVAERTKDARVRSALSQYAKDLCVLCKVPGAMDVVASYARSMGISVALC